MWLLRLKQAEAAGRAGGQDWQITFDAIGDAVAAIDGDGKVLRCNKSFTTIVKKPLSEIIGYSYWQLVPWNQEDGRVANGEILGQTHHGCVDVAVGDRWFRLCQNPVTIQTTEMAAVCVLSDITERKQAEKQLQQDKDLWEQMVNQRNGERLETLAQLHQEMADRQKVEQERSQLLVRAQQALEQAQIANQMKDEFLAVLSHELRSPLTAILGWSKLCRDGKLDPATTAHGLDVIERKARLQMQLIEDLLDISEIIQGKLNLDIRTVNLASLLEETINTLRPAAAEKAIAIHTDLDPNVPEIEIDAARLKQAISNLLSNAIKFTPDQGRVEITLALTGYCATIQVKDNGIGISADFLPCIFEMFRQAEKATTRKYGGLGLGLAIARHLVEMHGGRIWAESDGEGCGTTFTVRLPLFKSDRERSSKPKPQPTTAPSETTDTIFNLPSPC